MKKNFLPVPALCFAAVLAHSSPVLGQTSTAITANTDASHSQETPRKHAKPGAKKRRQSAAEANAIIANQIKALQEQLQKQEAQSNEQQSEIQSLQQQLQQSTTLLQQQSAHTDAVQTEIQQTEQQVTAAQSSATAATTGVAEAKTATAAVSKTADESKKQLDKMLNPEKYLTAPKVVSAVFPTRALPVDPPVKGGLDAAFRAGSVRVTPYGFIKATAAEDSSLPRGDDFPVPGFLNADTGPTTDPAFHLKARSTRVGVNFEWPDISPKLILTGRVETDFEGNFSRADNRNISSIRSNALQLRLAYARLDYAASEKTDLFFEGGQNWTLFGSSVLPGLLETTFLGAYFGDIYGRSPQLRVGAVQKLGGSRDVKISPEFAIMMPSVGNLPTDVGNQLGYGERQGSDGNHPEYESRVVLQFQADKAPGVGSAQLLLSGFSSHRAAIVLESAEVAAALPASYLAAFPKGAVDTSSGYGVQAGFSIPTRFVTLVGSLYRGGDLRFFFGGQLLSNYNDTAGLTNTHGVASVDGASTVVFGTNAAGQIVVAPQRDVRGYGGFAEIGLPISRWFDANPGGRNAGWQMYLHYGLDAAKHSDFAKAKNIGALGAGPSRSNLLAGTLYYRLNRWVQFAYEQSLYSSYSLPNAAGIYTPNTSVSGAPARVWKDRREEFGPIFSF